MDFLIINTCKNEEDPIKIMTLEWPQQFCRFFGRSRADDFVVNDRIWPKCELIQTFMHDTCKTEEDAVKNEGASVATKYLPLSAYFGMFGDDQGRSIYMYGLLLL